MVIYPRRCCAGGDVPLPTNPHRVYLFTSAPEHFDFSVANDLASFGFLVDPLVVCVNQLVILGR